MTPEIRAKISETLTGRVNGPCSEETKAKIGEANRGRVHTEEAKAKMSAGMKGRIPPNRGIPMSNEQKAKVSASRKGKGTGPRSDETRAKLSEAAHRRYGEIHGTHQSYYVHKCRCEACCAYHISRRQNVD
jgi:hypothetical protein